MKRRSPTRALRPSGSEIDRRALPVLVHPTAPPGDEVSGRRPIQPDRIRRLHVRHVACSQSNDLRRLPGSVPESQAHRRARRRRAALSRWTTRYLLRQHASRAGEDFRSNRARICGASTTIQSCFGKTRWPCVYRSPAKTACCTAPTIHTTSETCSGCLARVDALPAAQRDAVRGGNAKRLFGL